MTADLDTLSGPLTLCSILFKNKLVCHDLNHIHIYNRLSGFLVYKPRSRPATLRPPDSSHLPQSAGAPKHHPPGWPTRAPGVGKTRRFPFRPHHMHSAFIRPGPDGQMSRASISHFGRSGIQTLRVRTTFKSNQ